MIDEIEQCKRDINYESNDLSEIDINYKNKLENGFEKWKIGDKITWCYKEDYDFWMNDFKEEIKGVGGFDKWIKQFGNCFDGVLFTFPEKRFCIYETAIICCYNYPIEKENPTCFWVSLARLLKNKDLHKIYKIYV